MNEPIAYQLGHNAAKAPKGSINYRDKMTIPVNSFSHPKIQIPQYVQGWKDGRK